MVFDDVETAQKALEEVQGFPLFDQPLVRLFFPLVLRCDFI